MTKERLNFRAAVEADIPEIVSLLKLSLGESLMPKSEAYWRWKHVDNPFGPSPVLLAESGDKPVGVRAFMRWEWKKGNDVIKAVRAVDTATHPDYQGRGIFKKLTLALLEECKDQNLDLVFNTPNQKSKPGYLKMGWQEAGQLPINSWIKKPLAIITNSFSGKGKNEFLQLDGHSFRMPENGLPMIEDQWITHYSSAYLQWRYQQIPVIDYYSQESEKASIIYRLKQTDKGVELRITDIFGKKKGVRQLIKKLAQQTDCDYLTLSGCYKDIMPGLSSFRATIGPQVTVKEINHSVQDFIKFRNWTPALGDMEVF